MTMILGGWYLGDAQSRQQLPFTLNPSNDDISRVLRYLRGGSGLAGLKRMDIQEPDHRPYEIAVYAEAGRYMPVLREYAADHEHVVRTLKNEQAPAGLGVMMGQSYPAHFIVDDIDLVIQVFREFATHGDVSRALMP
jgi:hypothetical protein